MKKKMGVIGFGNFGQFMVPHLKPYFDISVFDLSDDVDAAANGCGVSSVSFADAVAMDVVVFAVPVQNLEEVLRDAVPFMKSDAIAMDVSSVKVRPVEMMRSILPDSIAILGTHPLFGPESGKDGLEGLKLVLCDVRGVDVSSVREFCEREFGLVVLERTAEAHDKEMAMVQGLTHFLAKALVRMDLKECEMDTHSYNHMFDIMRLVGHDSMALFETIQNQNPYTDKVRADFVAAFKELEQGLQLSK